MRMKKVGVDVQLILMRDYIHSFCGFLVKYRGCPEYRHGTNFYMEYMADMLQVEFISKRKTAKRCY